MSIKPMGFGRFYNTDSDTDTSNIFRIVSSGRNIYLSSNGKKEIYVKPAGRLLNQGIYPAAGDFVEISDETIIRVFERKNSLIRGSSGKNNKKDNFGQKEQVIASNLDYVFVVGGLDNDFNPRRLERYCALVYSCSIKPVIILNKCDLCDDLSETVSEVEMSVPGVEVFAVSAKENTGTDLIKNYMKPFDTCALIGSSGAGKSSIINSLCGFEKRKTSEISSFSGKGRHTTTTRDLIVLESGAMIIDNPGIREISLADGNEGVTKTFADIKALELKCRFRNCTHENEPGCAVLNAVLSGDLDLKRLKNYRKLSLEEKFLKDRESKSFDRIEKEKWKDIHKKIRKMKK